ncbi:hypothetical protein QTP70_006981 [Hemibagrus guttatus]|uniref:Gypsy retrotransposon integrase-like protein 1 n=1 Tax=Hemibagrus guttatus TaxID=175788 RepID=A0AAE0QYZ8_9TELE|nr:hypothetical protein QTP70_006981 [Hemibagrus guttatus]
MSFQRFNDVEKYLRFGTYGKHDKASKGVIRRCSKKFRWRDSGLWYMDGQRQRKVLRSEEEVRAVLVEHHNNSKHAGRSRCLKAVSDLYYWRSITKDIGDWIDNCKDCSHPSNPVACFQCIVPGCESSALADNEQGITFHRFPFSDVERLSHWIKFCQRDRWSLHSRSAICSRHFTKDCFDQSREVVCLKPDAVPTIEIFVTPQKDSNEYLDALSMESGDETKFVDQSVDEDVVHVEHPYSRDSSMQSSSRGSEMKSKVSLLSSKSEPYFRRYDALEKYLRTGVYSSTPYCTRYMVRRCAKRFYLQDGVLYYRHGSKRRKVLRNREEVVEVLKEHHDKRGHFGMSRCLSAISELYYWGTMTRDIEDWIGNCQFCMKMDESTQKYRCSVYSCNNYNGPLERTLGLTFHRFPFDDPERLNQWIRSLRRMNWRPRPSPAQINGVLTTEKDLQLSITELAIPQCLIITTPEILTPAQPHNTIAAGGTILGLTDSVSSGILSSAIGSYQLFEGSAREQRNSSLSARTVIQQCTHALLQVNPQTTDTDSEWVEIREGIVIYVCFFKCATEKVIPKMVNTLLNASFIPVSTGRHISIMELPGSVMIIPQDTMTGVVKGSTVQHHDAIESWKGLHFYEQFVTQCESEVAASAKCTEAGVVVRHGVYGNMQTLYLNSNAPLTHVLEF